MPNLLHLLTAAAVYVLHFSGIPTADKPETKIAVAAPAPERLPEEDDEFIPWLGDRLLTWNDFQSPPKRNTDAVASTSTSLGIAYQVEDGELTYQITCNFSKKKSWGSMRTDYILAHEQGHFDITEIFARKLHQALDEYDFNRKNYKGDISRIYQKIVAEKEAMQNAYDKESDHSRKRRTQFEWLDLINQMLEETEPWSNYP